jgi:hypothetical protein
MTRPGMKRLASPEQAGPPRSNLFQARAIARREGETRTFAGSREAKEFLIDWIVAEARRLDVPLSEVERKMLYASSDGWTLPEMEEVQETFNSYHEAVEYELKMTNLIRIVRVDVDAGGQQEYDAWTEAVRVLSREHHYLLDLIEASEGPIRRRTSRWKLLLAGIVILGLSIGIAYWVGHS